MLEQLLVFSRGAFGFAFVVAGLGFVVSPREDGCRRPYGALFAAVGALYTMSALDPIARLPVDLDNLVFASLIYTLGQCTFEIILFLFGSEHHRDAKRKVYIAGALYCGSLILLPLLDYLLDLGPALMGVEDGIARGPLHRAAYAAVCAWPFVVTFLGLRMARWRLSDLGGDYPDARRLVWGLYVLAPLLATNVLSLAFSLPLLYRLSHLCIQLYLLLAYFAILRYPGTFTSIRSQIGKEHDRRLRIGDEEAARIGRALRVLDADDSWLRDEELDIAALAERIGVPSYRLSHYFNARLSTSFPAWLNARRIDYVKRLIIEKPERGILELALDAGYKSKTAFNAQFSKLVGMSPTAFRSLHAWPKAEAGPGQPQGR